MNRQIVELDENFYSTEGTNSLRADMDSLGATFITKS